MEGCDVDDFEARTKEPGSERKGPRTESKEEDNRGVMQLLGKPGAPESGCLGSNLALPRRAVWRCSVVPVCSAARQGREEGYQASFVRSL